MRFAKRLLNAMPAAESSYAAHIRPLANPPKIIPTADVAGLQALADKHITKGIGRMKDHVFKEGKGLRVLTTVRCADRLCGVLEGARAKAALMAGRQEAAGLHLGYRSDLARTRPPGRDCRDH